MVFFFFILFSLRDSGPSESARFIFLTATRIQSSSESVVGSDCGALSEGFADSNFPQSPVSLCVASTAAVEMWSPEEFGLLGCSAPHFAVCVVSVSTALFPPLSTSGLSSPTATCGGSVTVSSKMAQLSFSMSTSKFLSRRHHSFEMGPARW